MRLPHFKKKFMAGALAAGLVMGAGGIAFAYFSATGSGTGKATVGTAAQTVKITQIGAAYSSLIPSSATDPYSTSACSVGCSRPPVFGGSITLAHLTPKWATKTWAQVTSVTVALVNFGPARTTFSVTLKLYGSPNTNHYTFTTQFNIPAGSATNQVAKDITFTLVTTDVFVDKTMVYSIHMTTAATSSLTGHPRTSFINIARVTPNNVSVGSNTGATWTGTITTTTVPTPTATKPTTNAAYAGYVPAVQLNVIGGVVPPLFPGSPAQPVLYAITNPTTASVHVGTVTTSIKTMHTGNTITGATTCARAWFTLTNPTYGFNQTVPSGTTILKTGPTTIQMTNVNSPQNACEGQTIPLTFSSN